MLFAWLASLIYAATAIFGKLTTRHVVANQWLFNFFWNLFICAAIVPVALFFGAGMPDEWGILVVAGILLFFVNTLYTLALYRLDVSVIGPLYNFRSVFTALLGAAFLGEVLTGSQYALIIIIFVSGIFLNVDERFKLRAFLRKESVIGLLAVLASALFGFAVKASIAANGFWDTSLWTEIIAQALMLGTLPLFYRDVHATRMRTYLGIFALGLLSAVGELAANKAYGINVTISSAIIAIPFSMLIAFVFSVFAPRLLEKHSIRVYAIRFIAAAVIIVAAIELS